MDENQILEEQCKEFLRDNKFSIETIYSATKIWRFIYANYKKYRPSSIDITHYLGGSVTIKCDNLLFPNIHSSKDKNLLYLISIIAEKSTINGKVYLNSKEGCLNNLSFSFSYAE